MLASNFKYFSYFCNPFSLSKPGIYSVMDDFGSCTMTENFNNFYTDATLITYDTSLLISHLREARKPLPSRMIDISLAFQLAAGIPSKYFSRIKPWSFWKRLADDFLVKDEFYSLYSIHHGQAEIPELCVSSYNLKQINTSLKRLWQLALEFLKDENEYSRFFEVETDVANIYYKREYEGIKVSEEAIENKLRELDQEIAKITMNLRFGWGIVDPDDYELISASTSSDFYEVYNELRLNHLDGDVYVEKNDAFNAIGQYKKAKRDKNTLLRISPAAGRVFPSFSSFGTVTGRTIVQNPPLQTLSRFSRNVLIPEDGMRFIYPDFSAFEPGILADFSGDDVLISLYNSGDIYTALGEYIFGSSKFRDKAKIVFLAYVYGMSMNGLVELVVSCSDIDKDLASHNLSEFFERFSRLNEYRDGVGAGLISSGRVYTAFGNHRKLYSGESNRWSLSQVIQGTASLIFKQATIKLCNEFGMSSLLLPMHDGILMQIDENCSREVEMVVSKIFVETFNSYCPKVKARVKFATWSS